MSRVGELEQQVLVLENRVADLEGKPESSTPDDVPSTIVNGSKYETNFIKTKKGNGIQAGDELIVRIKGAEVVTAKLSHKGRLIQVDQSHANDEDKDVETINLKLKTKSRFFRRGKPLSPGDYELHVWYWDNDTMRGGTYRDKFLIFV